MNNTPTPQSEDMRGKPLVQAFETPVAPDYVPSWEAVEGESGMHPPDAKRDPWAEQEAMNQLVALGYIEPPGENQAKAIERTVRESRFYLARVYLSTGRKEEALPILEELWARWPEERRFALRLVQCYQELGRLGECRRVVEDILARQEESTPAVDLLLGTLLLAENQPKEALKALQRAEQSDPERPGLHQRIGEAYLQMQRWRLAARAFRQALGIDPDSAAAYHGLALAHLRQKQYRKAAEAALSAVGLIHFYPSAHYHLGEALSHLGYHPRAAEAFRICLAQAPGTLAAHLRLADLYQNHLNEPERAEAHLLIARQASLSEPEKEDAA